MTVPVCHHGETAKLRDRLAGQELTVQYSFSRQIGEEKMEAPSCTQLLERQQVGQQATR